MSYEQQVKLIESLRKENKQLKSGILSGGGETVDDDDDISNAPVLSYEELMKEYELTKKE
jgi:hypothetical protein